MELKSTTAANPRKSDILGGDGPYAETLPENRGVTRREVERLMAKISVGVAEMRGAPLSEAERLYEESLMRQFLSD